MKKHILIAIMLTAVLVGCGHTESYKMNKPSGETASTSGASFEDATSTDALNDYNVIAEGEDFANHNFADSPEAKNYPSLVPIYYNEDYSNVGYGNSTLGNDGDLITCLAMIESYLSGLDNITPESFLSDHDDFIDENGRVEEDLFSLIARVNDFSYEKTTFSPDIAMKKIRLDLGVCLVKINHNSIFGQKPHYIILTGLDTKTTRYATFVVRDPSKVISEKYAVGFNGNDEPLYRITDLTAILSTSSEMYMFW